jgi:hypothetical protein
MGKDRLNSGEPIGHFFIDELQRIKDGISIVA